MATEVLNYASGVSHELRSTVFKKELVMWRTKSDPMIVALSHNSMASCWDNEKRWDNIEHLAEQKVPTQWTDAITLEGLKSLYNCCFTCGVSWAEGQASLDCAECGGYALHRPCVHCDGSCGRVWRRDLVASHQLRRSQWIGKCEKSLRGPAIGKSRDFFP